MSIAEMKIVDPAGDWQMNTGDFPLPDPESGTVFQPNVATKALRTAWGKMQPTLTEIDDPTAPAPKKAAPAPEKVKGE